MIDKGCPTHRHCPGSLGHMGLIGDSEESLHDEACPSLLGSDMIVSKVAIYKEKLGT